MENDIGDDASSYAWWCDSNNNRLHQSQWLKVTSSELDEKIKMILTLVEDDGETFAKRAEMYYEKRPELIKMVQELHRSYCALADKYDQLKSESFRAINFGSSSSNSTRQTQHVQTCNENGKYDATEFSKLIEDNLEKQGELIRRNDEKRKVIKELSLKIDELMHENGVLKSSWEMARANVDMKQKKSQISRMKEVILGIFKR